MTTLLQRKSEKRVPIAISVPLSVKEQWHALMKQADEQGFDLTTSIATALQGLIKQARTELERHGRNGTTATV